MINEIDASSFKHSIEIYEEEFKIILSGITFCYALMINNNVQVPSNDENRIRDILYLEYLRKDDIRKKANLINYRFDRETSEDESKGRTDIRVLSKNDFEIHDAYYIIECKRLDNENLKGSSGLNEEYIKNGIMRFVEQQYSTYYTVNGMIGFIVENMDINNNIDNINYLIKNNYKQVNSITKLTFIDFIKDFNYSFYSIHEDIKGKEIKLYHLMFDFSKNTIINKEYL